MESTTRSNRYISQEMHLFKKPEIRQVSNLQTGLVAAACATGCFVVETLCYPFTTVKVRLQANKEQFIPFFKAARGYYQQEGMKQFFKGYSGTIPCCFIYNFIWFFLYEKCNLFQLNMMNRNNLEQNQIERIKRFAPFVSGALAEIPAMFVHTLFNIPKLRMQIDNPKYNYKNLFDGLVKVFKTEGVSKFYKTSQVQISANVFYSGVLMMIYENLRKSVLDKKTEKALTLRETLSVTFLTSTFCSLTMNPFEVIIARYVNHSSVKGHVTVRGLIKELIQNEGIRGFYKGVPGRLIYGLTHASVYMPTFEFLRTTYGVKLN